ncbi:hypothetical protein FEP29_05383 [Burkholderia multivorans]|nr:hypothetical protein [Burkholderia multivorans]MDR9166093.1 hypothetical protein [Burkholderia multivorans]MDR9276362.1 hypothetical protein [Burkholderia multivorans]
MKLLIGAALVAASAIATVAHAREVYLQGGMNRPGF